MSQRAEEEILSEAKKAADEYVMKVGCVEKPEFIHHDFLEGWKAASIAKDAEIEGLKAKLNMCSELMDAVLKSESHHDENGHHYLKVMARSIFDPAAQIQSFLSSLNGGE